jgi:hypothetical protein
VGEFAVIPDHSDNGCRLAERGDGLKQKQIKQLIQKYMTYWVKTTGLGYWDIKCLYSEAVEEGRTCDVLLGEASATWQYQMATITFYPKSMTEMSEDEIERLVVHELMHVFLNEMREEGIDHEERVATMLAKAFLWVKGVDK